MTAFPPPPPPTGGGARPGPARAPAELSSLASTVADVAKRVTALADATAAARADELSVELYRIERALLSAQRKLEKLARP